METSQWNTAWGIALSDFSGFAMTAKNHTQTLRITNNVSGTALRVHFNNLHGKRPLVLSGVGLRVEGANKAWEGCVTLRGQMQICLAAGAEAYSDAVPVAVSAGDTIAVSASIEGEMPLADLGLYMPPALAHLQASGTIASSMAEFPPQLQQASFIYGIDRVEVQGRRVSEVAFFGDSITQMGHWSTPLALKLYEKHPGAVSVYNCGIGGNRILHDAPPVVGGLYGAAAVKRFEQDVFGAQTPSVVIVQIGVNDLCHPIVHDLPGQAVTAEGIIEGLALLADTAHRHSARVMCCTLLPFMGYPAWNEDMERARQTVNEWVRSNTTFDGCLDFDRTLQDDADARKMKDDCHMGDWLHPNVQGGQLLADGVDCASLLLG